MPNMLHHSLCVWMSGTGILPKISRTCMLTAHPVMHMVCKHHAMAGMTQLDTVLFSVLYVHRVTVKIMSDSSILDVLVVFYSGCSKCFGLVWLQVQASCQGISIHGTSFVDRPST